ncbi:hypothetical protein [Halalkalicoccus salilacus]|uniref:hypothetical protein n=1 Tax=Halalkalicoccus sp. GCM10025704 TaxID=3252662 RepID=UPI0036187695
MLRDSVAHRLRETRSEGAYLFPAYDDYCFSNVQGTAFSVLGESLGRRLPDDALEESTPTPRTCSSFCSTASATSSGRALIGTTRFSPR